MSEINPISGAYVAFLEGEVEQLSNDRDEMKKELREAKSAFSYIATHVAGPISDDLSVASYARHYEMRIHELLEKVGSETND